MEKTIQTIEAPTIVKLWEKVFPNSMMLSSRACLGDSWFYKGKLAKNRNESANGILDNDPLFYVFEIEGDTYKEHHNSIYIKPNSPYLVYSSEHMRKKTIKNITEEKLEKRFQEIKAHIVANKDNFIHLLFDINTKIA